MFIFETGRASVGAVLMWAALVAAVVIPPAGAQSPAADNDRHAGYYYPDPKSEETYRSRARALPDSDRDRRIGFIVAFNKELAGDPYPQRFAIYAKGTEAEKLILVGLDDGAFATLYRARAMLAVLTARARASPLFGQLGVKNLFTFYDLARPPGFERTAISDGRDRAHRVRLR